MAGFIMVPRDIFTDLAFFDAPFSEREAWIWLISEASWKPRERRIGTTLVRIDRGQLAGAIRFMAEAWKWHRSKVERFLKRLSNRGMIMTQTETGISLITIRNYDIYQTKNDKAETPARHVRDTAETNEKKGEKKKKEGEEESNQEDPLGSSSVSVLGILTEWAGTRAAESFIAYRYRMRKPLSIVAAKRIALSLKTIFQSKGDPDDALGLAEEQGWVSIRPDWYFKKISEREIRGKSTTRSPNGPDAVVENIARIVGL